MRKTNGNFSVNHALRTPLPVSRSRTVIRGVHSWHTVTTTEPLLVKRSCKPRKQCCWVLLESSLPYASTRSTASGYPIHRFLSLAAVALSTCAQEETPPASRPLQTAVSHTQHSNNVRRCYLHGAAGGADRGLRVGRQEPAQRLPGWRHFQGVAPRAHGPPPQEDPPQGHEPASGAQGGTGGKACHPGPEW